MGNQKGIALFVRELRSRLGLSQEKFAAKLGVSFPSVNRWESSRAKPSPMAMQKIEELVASLATTDDDLKDWFAKLS